MAESFEQVEARAKKYARLVFDRDSRIAELEARITEQDETIAIYRADDESSIQRIAELEAENARQRKSLEAINEYDCEGGADYGIPSGQCGHCAPCIARAALEDGK